MQSAKVENFLQYFQNRQDQFDSHLIKKSNNPYKFETSDTLLNLPEYFVSMDSTINIADYIENQRYEGILVLKNSQIIYENYWNGFSKEKTHVLNSITKSIMSILVGIAIDEGLIRSREDLVTKYLPQFKNTLYKDVTIDDCLDMVSGVKWENDWLMVQDFMWKWGWNTTTAEKFLLEREFLHKPGEKFVYNSMDPLMIGLILKSVIGEKSISEYMQEKLWAPLGAENNAYFEKLNEYDIEPSWYGIYTTMNDLAKIGQLYLQEGNWRDTQIVSRNWVKQSFQAHRETTKPISNDSWRTQDYNNYGWGYNNYWWIPDDSHEDEILGWGMYGQTLYVNKQKNIVVVSFRAEGLTDYDENYTFEFENRSMLDFVQAIGNSVE